MLALFVGQASRAMGCQRNENGYWLTQKHSLFQAWDRVYTFAFDSLPSRIA
jgi:hypothetical protein